MRFAICSSLASLLLLPAAIQAAPLPGADRPATEVRLGSGPSIGASLQLNPVWEIGFSAALPAFDFQNDRYFKLDLARASAYGLVQIFKSDGFYIAGVFGLFGDLSLANSSTGLSSWGIQAGAALAYDLNSALSLRLNIVPGIDFQVPPTGWLLAPTTGVAIVWRPQPQLNLSLGINGNGDLLGLGWGF